MNIVALFSGAGLIFDYSFFAGYAMQGRWSPYCIAGLTLVEVMIFLAVVAVGITGTFTLFVNQRLAQRIAEERRIASLAAEQKLDEIRIFVNKGKTLDQAFQYYGPLPLPQGAPGATFDVPALTAFVDYDRRDAPRPNPRAVGTVSIINDEVPDEKLFGYDYANQCAAPPFGVDIDGNGGHGIETGFGSSGAVGYNDACPKPFPLDLNGNGSDGSPAHPWDSNVVEGFVMLPIVITIQWDGAAGRQRFDLFTVLTANRATDTQ